MNRRKRFCRPLPNHSATAPRFISYTNQRDNQDFVIIKSMSIKAVYQDQKLHIQELDYTCGPVTLLNVLSLKGNNNHDEFELAEACQAKPESGTPNTMMVKTASKLGLEVLEAKKEAEIKDLEDYLKQSAHVIVCYRSLGGGGHYSIVAESDQKALYLFDCAYGLIRIEKPTFYKRWRNKHEPIKRWFMAIK